ncbi:MAG TPA: MaoC family dehydratase [Herbaspirillum sp.]|jgi:acyl dehydratase
MSIRPTDHPERLYLDDLKPRQRFTSATFQIDKERLISFASEFDPQPFHLDEEQAKQTLFQGLAASGWHTASVTMRLLVDGGLPIAGGLVGANVEISWPAPTRPGDILQVESEILEVTPSRSRPERGIVTVKGETRNQRNEVVQITTVKLIVARRPQP